MFDTKDINDEHHTVGRELGADRIERKVGKVMTFGIFDCSACACAAPPAAPDYSGIAASNEASAAYAKQAADADLAFRRQVYEESKPGQARLEALASQVAQAQLGGMEQQNQFAREQNQYYQQTYKPIEQLQALQSQGGLEMSDADIRSLASRLGIDPAQAVEMMGASKRSYETAAQQALTQANAQANSAYGQGLRQLTRMGGDPNRLAAAAAQLANQQTLAGVGAANNARQNARAQNIAQTAGTAAFGRNMPNTAGQMYGLGINSGNAAVANQNQGFMSGLPYAQFASGGVGNALGAAGLGVQSQLGLGGLMNQGYMGQISAYNAGLQAQNAQGGLDIGSLMAGGAKLYTAFGGSDRRLKEDIELVGRDPRTGLNLYEFRYIENPSTRWRGVMADEVERIYPEAVAYNDHGFAMVNYGMLGMQMQEVQP